MASASSPLGAFWFFVSRSSRSRSFSALPSISASASPPSSRLLLWETAQISAAISAINLGTRASVPSP